MASTWKERVPKWWQALLILVGGIVLGLSSCAALLSGLSDSGSNILALFFAVGFFGGVIVAIFGLVLLIKRLMNR